MQDPAVTQVTEPPPSSGQDDYNPFTEGGKPAKKEEPEVGEGGGGKNRKHWVEVGVDTSRGSDRSLSLRGRVCLRDRALSRTQS